MVRKRRGCSVVSISRIVLVRSANRARAIASLAWLHCLPPSTLPTLYEELSISLQHVPKHLRQVHICFIQPFA